MTKKLIYFTLSNKLDYLEIAKLCLDSLKNNNYDGDILFITDKKNEIEKISPLKDVLFFEVPLGDLFKSSANKLKIYLYDRIKEYDKIIYCDLDILWLKNPNIIFDLIDKDKIYISQENELMSEQHWGGRILTNDEKKNINENRIFGLNAGFFAFNSKVVNFFKKIDEFMNQNIDKVEDCLEQPFLNTFVFRHNLYEIIPNNYISHKGYSISEFNGVVLHFAGGPGNSTIKLEKMKKYENFRN
jgi:lipopolysaccharide biosynthesis glycosyltransferase